ncbi:MAG: SOSS complex subunit B family protein [Nanoarchaeota archaeon]|nr:SOSS complex subunit B family protein [Nanoarchaeota archaeon]
MAITDLQPRQGKVDIIVEVVSMEDVREFNKFGKSGRVCNANVKDETGSIKLTLWNEDIDKVKPGMKIHIENGYVNEWQGEKQLTTGKFGKLEIVEEGSAPVAEPQSETPATEPKPATQEDVTIEEDVI